MAGAAACGAVLAAFVLLLGGVAAIAGRVSGRPAAGVAAGAVLGVLCLASFHLGDPFLEWGGAGSHSRAVLAVLNGVNPAGGSIGRALGIDWLRLPIMYRGFPGSTEGGLSAASYYVFRFPPWWFYAAVHGGLGAVLLLLSGQRSIPVPGNRRRL